MRSRLWLLAAVALLAACAAPATSNRALATSSPGVFSKTEAQQVLTSALQRLNVNRTAAFRQAVNFNSGSKMLVSSITGVLDQRIHAWSGDIYFGEGSDALSPVAEERDVAMSTVGTTHGTYITVLGWPSRLEGRWLQLTEQLVHSYAPSAVGLEELTSGRPQALRAFSDARAVSGRRTPDSTVLQADLPLLEALTLAQVAPRLEKAGVDILTLRGSVRVTIELGNYDTQHHLTLSSQALIAATQSLSTKISKAIPQVRVELELSDFARPVQIDEPKASQLIQPAEIGTDRSAV
jgi:hypothetical protein